MQGILGASDLAKLLHVDQSTVHRRIARGELTPTYYVGRSPIFTEKDAAALLRGERQLPIERASHDR